MSTARTLIQRDGDVRIVDGFLDEARATALHAILLREIPWRTDRVTVFGRAHPIPRMHAWFGPAPYQWSGIVMQPAPMPRVLDDLRAEIEHTVGVPVPTLLANLYRDGDDRMGWHADDEPELGPLPTIASVSLGAERDLRFRHRNDRETLTVPLPHGSLLVMQGRTQEHWQHELPRRKRVKTSRINLTFRTLRR